MGLQPFVFRAGCHACRARFKSHKHQYFFYSKTIMSFLPLFFHRFQVSLVFKQKTYHVPINCPVNMYFNQHVRRAIRNSWSVKKLSLSAVTTLVQQEFADCFGVVEHGRLQHEIYRFLKVVLPFDDARLVAAESEMTGNGSGHELKGTLTPFVCKFYSPVVAFVGMV